MRPILLKINCRNLSGFKDGMLDVDFVTEKRVNQDEQEDNVVMNVANNLYKFNTLAVLGINASGKTTTMRILSSIMNVFLGNSSLRLSEPIMQYFEDYLIIETYYYYELEKSILKLASTIVKSEDNGVIFSQERLYMKKVTSKQNGLTCLILKMHFLQWNVLKLIIHF